MALAQTFFLLITLTNLKLINDGLMTIMPVDQIKQNAIRVSATDGLTGLPDHFNA
jgi:hypothetical protein